MAEVKEPDAEVKEEKKKKEKEKGKRRISDIGDSRGGSGVHEAASGASF